MADEQSGTPYSRLGEGKIRAIVERFYDAMHDADRRLLEMHELGEDGRVTRAARDRFALFFIGWLGGPETYREVHGHPRLRMRHAHLPVSAAMRDAWLRSMEVALDAEDVRGELRERLDARLYEVAEMLRNQGD